MVEVFMRDEEELWLPGREVFLPHHLRGIEKETVVGGAHGEGGELEIDESQFTPREVESGQTTQSLSQSHPSYSGCGVINSAFIPPAQRKVMSLQTKLEVVCLELLKKTSTDLPPDVERALEKAEKGERDPVARANLRAILENLRVARERGVPLCQDTGLPLFYFWMDPSLPLDPFEAARKAVKKATREGFLRPNTVHPLSRKNEGNNLGKEMPRVKVFRRRGEEVEVTVLLKGAGSENCSKLIMLAPEKGLEGIKELVVKAVAEAGGKPCPPIILGVGIGGNAELSMELANLSLLRPLPERHREPSLRRLEEELEKRINRLGLGPMGLGGKTTCLGVKVEYAHTHTASLPVSLSFLCWAARRASASLEVGG